ncbi:MAG: hypothetical protein GX053_09755 [Tissierella sp.]|nr:hypothetical protein [Tissierella sp.]
MNKKVKLSIIILISLFLLTGCMPGDGSYSPDDPANFLSGIWHGWTAPISLILSIGNSSRSIYETINTGFWYDFGFYMAIISGFGGLSLSRGKKKN